ncbi:hypothetical protein N9006_00210 [bacterium]|nr:hypothetical protein [bacterium]MDB4367942.1 hypothetical protein [Mariniblastus sp.]MDB4391751.1 hypothetical protein [bacterium]
MKFLDTDSTAAQPQDPQLNTCHANEKAVGFDGLSNLNITPRV